MDQLFNRFNELSFIYYAPLHNSPSYQDTIDELISYYRKFQLYTDFGPKSMNYLCGLAVRYAYATLRIDDKVALKAYALWLSLIWLIDGFFDKCRTLTCKNDVEVLRQIFLLEPIKQKDHTLFEVVIGIYDRYLDLITPYCMNNLPAFSELTDWLLKYLDTLIVPTTPRKTHRKNNSEGSPRVIIQQNYNIYDYTNWRLDSGAMMCVAWHIILFNRLPADPIIFDYFFELASLIVSFHNDVISYRRDLQQMTPNLVSVIKEPPDDDFVAMDKAIIFINGLYSEILIEFIRLSQKYPEECELIAPLVLDILEGSCRWTYSEPRYEVGIKMLHALKENNKKQFYALLFDADDTPGDPQNGMPAPRVSPTT